MTSMFLGLFPTKSWNATRGMPMKPFIQTAIESGEILQEDIQDIIENVKRTPTRRDEEGQIVHERGVYTTANGNEYLLYRNTIKRQEKTEEACIDVPDVTESVARGNITGENDDLHSTGS